MRPPQFLLHLAAYQRGRYVFLCAIQVVIWLLLMLPGLLGQKFFDLLTGKAHVAGGIAGLAIAFIVSEAALIGSYFLNVAQEAVASSSVASLVRSNLFDAVLRRCTEPLCCGSAGAAVSRFRDDIDEIVSFLSLLTSAIGMGVFVAVGIAVMFSINAEITLAVFIPLVVIIVVAERAGGALERYRTQSREAAAAVTGAIGEGFGAIEAIQAAGAEIHLATHIAELNKARKNTALREGLFSQIVGSINAHSISLGTAAILLLAAKEMRAGTFTVGDFALFTFYLGYVTTIIGLVGSMNVAYKKVTVSIRRVAELAHGSDAVSLAEHKPVLEEAIEPIDVPTQPRVRLAAQPSLRGLRARGLTVRYGSSSRGLVNCDIDILPGSLTVITGRTGSGKTTLLRALLGLIPTESGTIEWNGERIGNDAESLAPPRAAFTPQTPTLFSTTIRENIHLGMPEVSERLQSVLQATALDRDLRDMDQGLDTVLGAHGSRLSGGQTQRVAVARMLLRDAELLVMDDPSSALDLETERHLFDAIRSDGRTFVVASTRTTALNCADTVIVLKNGQVESQGPMRVVKRASSELQVILNGCDE